MISEIELGPDCGSVTACAFNAENTQAILGTSNGQVCCWDIKEKKLAESPFCLSDGPVTQIQRFYGVSGRFFLISVDNKQCFIFVNNSGEGLLKKT